MLLSAVGRGKKTTSQGQYEMLSVVNQAWIYVLRSLAHSYQMRYLWFCISIGKLRQWQWKEST
jgi:hypothetical protein